MPDWTKSMEQVFEYYIVDPGTWKDRQNLKMVKSCSITRDATVETLGSVTIDLSDIVDECYIRAYLITIQNGIMEKFPLSTFLVQTSSSKFDGRKTDISLDAYTPLIELKENPPELGYSVLKDENIMQRAYQICRDNVRAPVVETIKDTKLYNDFVANTDDTWLTFTSDLIANAEYGFDLDELGRILFAPNQKIGSLQPVWTFDDDNSSILYSELSMDQDLYGIPNVVEVIYSDDEDHFYSRVVNDDENSPVSTIKRGREIIHRVTDLKLSGIPTQEQVDAYAKKLLSEVSKIQYTITYTHAYCPVRLFDCVRLNHERAGLNNIKARVISQTIKCEPGCPVTEKAVYTSNLWEG